MYKRVHQQFKHTSLLPGPVILAGLLVVSVVFFSCRVSAQTADVRHPVLGSIVVLGNRTTDAEVILRELTVHVGDTLTREQLEYSRTRIYSLGLFNRVDMTYPPLDTTVLIISVEERWYLFPVPVLGLVDKDWRKVYYGLGLVHFNLAGRGQKFFAGFALGYDPWVAVSYRDPWILGRLEMFSESEIRYSRVRNKSLLSRGDEENFDEIHYGLSQVLGKRFTPFFSAWIDLGFDYVEVTSRRNGRTLSGSGIDRYASVGVGAVFDTRNLKEYPTYGSYSSLMLRKYGLFFGVLDHVVASVDFRKYVEFSNFLSFGVRGFSAMSIGPRVPNYLHMYYGYSNRLRGHFYRIQEGENIFGVAVETRIPIVKEEYLVLNVPFLPPQFSTLRLGLYAAVFANAGTTWNRGDKIDLRHLPAGYGAGLHLLLPYGHVLRAEGAVDEKGSGELYLVLGASF